MELTLFKVSEVYCDMKLVTGHLFQMLGSAGPSKIAPYLKLLLQQGGKTSEDGSSECDTFILTN